MAHPFISLLRNGTLPATILRTSSRQIKPSISRSLPSSPSQSFLLPHRRQFTSHSPSSRYSFNPWRRLHPTRPNRRLFSNSSSSSTTGSSSSSSSTPQSLTQRLKKITREYGWAAVGVYLALSAADLPICYLLVRALGVDRIGEIEDCVVRWFKSVWRKSESAVSEQKREEVEEVEKKEESRIQAASKAVRGEASVWTQLVLAYAIHKSVFIFFRVPLTAAITPKVVKTLRSWGWNIGKRAR